MLTKSLCKKAKLIPRVGLQFANSRIECSSEKRKDSGIMVNKELRTNFSELPSTSRIAQLLHLCNAELISLLKFEQDQSPMSLMAFFYHNPKELGSWSIRNTTLSANNDWKREGKLPLLKE